MTTHVAAYTDLHLDVKRFSRAALKKSKVTYYLRKILRARPRPLRCIYKHSQLCESRGGNGGMIYIDILVILIALHASTHHPDVCTTV